MSRRKRDPNRYPIGWGRSRVEAVIAHYDRQTDEEAIAEDEASFRKGESLTSVLIPTPLLDAVRQLVDAYDRAQERATGRAGAGRRTAKRTQAARVQRHQ